jgi:hypothetical protein
MGGGVIPLLSEDCASPGRHMKRLETVLLSMFLNMNVMYYPFYCANVEKKIGLEINYAKKKYGIRQSASVGEKKFPVPKG